MLIIDIIQSYIIKGVIILIIIQVMLMLQQTMYEQNARAQSDQEMSTIASVVSSDIRQLGSDTVTVRPYTRLADTSSITFMVADTNSFSTPVQISYTWSKPTSKYYLYRTINAGTPLLIGRNLSRFYLTYYDDLGAVLSPCPLSVANRLKIKSIGILSITEKIAFSTDTIRSYWESRIFLQNLYN
jgi:hypothetical protein